MINQTTTKFQGQTFYFYHLCAPNLTDVILRIYNSTNALTETLTMTEIGTTGVYKVSYATSSIGIYLGICSSATAAASSDDVLRIRSTSVTELTVIPLPSASSNVTISNAVGVGVKCD